MPFPTSSRNPIKVWQTWAEFLRLTKLSATSPVKLDLGNQRFSIWQNLIIYCSPLANSTQWTSSSITRPDGPHRRMYLQMHPSLYVELSVCRPICHSFLPAHPIPVHKLVETSVDIYIWSCQTSDHPLSSNMWLIRFFLLGRYIWRRQE